MKKIAFLISLCLMANVAAVSAAYQTVDCSTSTIFSENSCNQCFDGGEKTTGDNIGMMEDLWKNDSSTDRLIYKEEQEMPKMVNPVSDKVTWSQNPITDKDFWAFTPELENIYSSGADAYVLKPGASVTWLKSNLGAAYKLDSNKADKGTNIGLLVYPIMTHAVLEDGTPSPETTTHKECVLFKSADANKAPEPTPTPVEVKAPPVKALPKTGPAENMLVILALMLTAGVLYYRRKSV
ncbi:MAG: LPXTG cell wall anchor domain-containing protein [Candidatus Gracilibacteria bacterium]|nr:LPXTG cell wall anchor domain-containing protein [Candidatus Gracilibacteria bacterium]